MVKKDLQFLIIILLLIALILGEIGFLGYKFWFKCPGRSRGEPLVVVPSSPPHSPSSETTAKAFVQLIFGWIEEIGAEKVVLRTEDGEIVTYPLVEAEIFGFKPQKAKETSFLFTFFDREFGEREAVESLEVEEINPDAPAYLVVERTADGLYLGRRLVVVTE